MLVSRREIGPVPDPPVFPKSNIFVSLALIKAKVAPSVLARIGCRRTVVQMLHHASTLDRLNADAIRKEAQPDCCRLRNFRVGVVKEGRKMRNRLPCMDRRQGAGSSELQATDFEADADKRPSA